MRFVPVKANVTRPDIYDHLGWLGNLIGGSVVRWDANSYLTIASHGYTKTQAGLPVFFPLYPLVIHIGAYVTGSVVVAGAAISVFSFGLALILLHRLTELELSRRVADVTMLVLAFAPLSFFFTAIYTESLFLCLSVGALLAARKERWAAAGLLAAAATLTRVTGVLLIVPLVISYFRLRRRPDWRLTWVACIPVALAVYVAFLALNGFSPLAPFSEEAVWHRVSVGPLGGIAAGIGVAIKSLGVIVAGKQPIYAPTRFGPLTPSAESILLLVVLVVAAVLTVSCVRRLPLQYGAYAAATLLMSVSSPMVGQPLISLDRYVLTIVPLWMAAGAWIAKRRLEHVVIAAGALLLVFYTAEFSSWSFIA